MNPSQTYHQRHTLVVLAPAMLALMPDDEHAVCVLTVVIVQDQARDLQYMQAVTVSLAASTMLEASALIKAAAL